MARVNDTERLITTYMNYKQKGKDIGAHLPSRVWVAWAPTLLETGDGWFESSRPVTTFLADDCMQDGEGMSR